MDKTGGPAIPPLRWVVRPFPGGAKELLEWFDGKEWRRVPTVQGEPMSFEEAMLAERERRNNVS